MAIVAFEKEISFKAQAYLAKRLFDSTEVFNLRKKCLVSTNGEKKV